jgi:hypothetical protein
MVFTFAGQRKRETPLTKKRTDEKETYTSFMDIDKRQSHLVKRTKGVSGVTDASDSPIIFQVRECDEGFEVNTPTRKNAPTGKGSDGSLVDNKENDGAHQKRKLRGPCLSRADALGRHVSSSKRNPSAHSVAVAVSRSSLVCSCLVFERVLNRAMLPRSSSTMMRLIPSP